MSNTKAFQKPLLRVIVFCRAAVQRSGMVLVASLVLLFAKHSVAQDTSIQLLSPKGGEAFAVGSSLTVQWTLRNQAVPGGGVAVLLSPDEGKSWLYLTKNTILSGDRAVYRDSVGTFTWSIVDSVRMYGTVYMHLASAQCLVRVEATYDEKFLPSTSNTFSINPGTHTIYPAKNSRIVNGDIGEMLRANNNLGLAVSLDGKKIFDRSGFKCGRHSASGIHFGRTQGSVLVFP